MSDANTKKQGFGTACTPTVKLLYILSFLYQERGLLSRDLF